MTDSTRWTVDGTKSSVRYSVKTGFFFRTRGVLRALSGSIVTSAAATSGEVEGLLSGFEGAVGPLTEGRRPSRRSRRPFLGHSQQAQVSASAPCPTLGERPNGLYPRRTP